MNRSQLIGKNIQLIRKAYNIPQSVIANIFDTNDELITDLENGVVSIDDEHLTKIAENFGITKEDMLIEDNRLFVNNLNTAYKNNLSSTSPVNTSVFGRMINKIKSLLFSSFLH